MVTSDESESSRSSESAVPHATSMSFARLLEVRGPLAPRFGKPIYGGFVETDPQKQQWVNGLLTDCCLIIACAVNPHPLLCRRRCGSPSMVWTARPTGRATNSAVANALAPESMMYAPLNCHCDCFANTTH